MFKFPLYLILLLFQQHVFSSCFFKSLTTVTCSSTLSETNWSYFRSPLTCLFYSFDTLKSWNILWNTLLCVIYWPPYSIFNVNLLPYPIHDTHGHIYAVWCSGHQCWRHVKYYPCLCIIIISYASTSHVHIFMSNLTNLWSIFYQHT